MITKSKSNRKSKVKVGKLKETRELSPEDAKKVKGGKANFSDLSFVHLYDKASPVLGSGSPAGAKK